MRELVLGISAAALIFVGGLVAAQSARSRHAADTAAAEASTGDTPPYMSAYTRLAAADTSPTAFNKLDTDHDGRISALEAAENPRIAAAFTRGDKDKDGYLSKEELAALSQTTSHPDVQASSPSGDRASDPNGDQDATSP